MAFYELLVKKSSCKPLESSRPACKLPCPCTKKTWLQCCDLTCVRTVFTRFYSDRFVPEPLLSFPHCFMIWLCAETLAFESKYPELGHRYLSCKVKS